MIKTSSVVRKHLTEYLPMVSIISYFSGFIEVAMLVMAIRLLSRNWCGQMEAVGFTQWETP